MVSIAGSASCHFADALLAVRCDGGLLKRPGSEYEVAGAGGCAEARVNGEPWLCTSTSFATLGRIGIGGSSRSANAGLRNAGDCKDRTGDGLGEIDGAQVSQAGVVSPTAGFGTSELRTDATGRSGRSPRGKGYAWGEGRAGIAANEAGRRMPPCRVGLVGPGGLPAATPPHEPHAGRDFIVSTEGAERHSRVYSAAIARKISRT
eukprot:scaffold74427_cov27-Tisochrysis_lutea.AAC.1